MTKLPLPTTYLLPILSFIILTTLPFLVISRSEEEILLQIKQQWSNQPPMNSWNSTTHFCEWPGINCSGGVYVTGFSLNSQNIGGEIPSSICDLKNLTVLDLGNNHIPGNFPTFLNKCSKLQTLNLSSNNFVGKLPDTINELPTSLQHLKLSANNFTGDIPRSLAQLKELMILYLDSNLFNGSFPSELGHLENLEELVLAFNPFAPNKLPKEFGKLKNLKLLWMTQCNLIGELPSEIISWKRLNFLDLSHNQLSGLIPPILGSLPVLSDLNLSNNQFSGKIPLEVGQLNLASLDLSYNKLTGKIPLGIDSRANKNSFLHTHLCSDTGFLYLPKCSNHHRNPILSSKYFPIIIILAVVSFIAILYFLVRAIRQRKKKQQTWKLTSFHRLQFTEEMIVDNLTDGNTIGSGGSGRVYKIPINQSGDAVAVKRIYVDKTMNNNNLEKQFNAEVQVLGTIRHSNIIKLHCCLSSENSKLLVYEYMENQSLDKWIRKSERQPISPMSKQAVLAWPARLKIAKDAAGGLSYMHHDCSPPIVHRDIKSSNILLDSEFNAKIADFGLARILIKAGEPNTVSSIAGTFGYIDPEYYSSSRVDEKTDIYSFGVVLLELVTGKEPRIADEHTNLAGWALSRINEGHPIIDVLDKEVLKPCYLEEMTKVFKMGLMCTSVSPSDRPSMKEVFDSFNGMHSRSI